MGSTEDAVASIARLRTRAERLRTAVAEILPAALDGVSEPAAAAVVGDRMQKAIARLVDAAKEPVTFGVVGEFGAGKSLLVGTLLGCPGLLPVAERASTGNVTALYLEPAAEGERTTPGDYADCDLFPVEELRACVVEILGKLRAKILEVQSNPKNATTDLSRFVDREAENPVDAGWSAFEGWCRTWLWTADAIPRLTGDVEPRRIAAELLRLRDGHLAAANLLGQRLRILREQLPTVLDLGDAEEIPTSFPERTSHQNLTSDEAEASVDGLAVLFHVVRRVSYRVKVDRQVWPLQQIGDGSPLVLLDFPGLGSTRSGHRDEFLSRAELRHVQTIVTVYARGRESSQRPQEFLTMLASHGRSQGQLADSVIAVANGFDAVAPPIPPPADLAGLRSVSSAFHQFHVNAGDLVAGRYDRLRLVSSVIGMVRHGYPLDGLSAHELGRLDPWLRRAPATADGWAAVAATLGDPQWKGTVAALGRDGGIDSLRSLITTHVRTHGFALKLAGLEQLVPPIRKELRRLNVHLDNSAVQGGEQARARSAVIHFLDSLRHQHTRILESAEAFGDPTAVQLDGVALSVLQQSRASIAVYTWPSWRRLLARTKGGLIPRQIAQAPIHNGILTGLPVRPKDPDAITTVFSQAFSASFRTVTMQTGVQLEQALTDWFRHWQEQLDPLRDRLADEELRGWLETGLERLRSQGGDTNVDWLPVLDSITHIEPMLQRWLNIRADEAPKRAEEAAEIAQERIPLQENHYLPWHSDFPEDGSRRSELARHPWYVLRMRRELATAFEQATASWLHRDISSFTDVFVSTWQVLEQYIPTTDEVYSMFPSGNRSATDQIPSDTTGTTGSAATAIQNLLREWSDS